MAPSYGASYPVSRAGSFAVSPASFGRAGTSPGPTTTTGIIAANRAQVPTVLITAVPSPFTSRRSHYASPEGAISALQTVDFGYYIADTMLIAATGVTYTIKRYIEHPANTFTQVTWGGATSKTITYASAVFVSDPVAVTIPAGAKFWERTVHITGAARDIPGVEMPAIHTTLGLDEGNSSSDLGNSGTIASGSGTNTIGSVAIIGTVAKGNARAFVAFGDSLTWGVGDITSVGSKGGSGWISRGLDPLYPWLKVAKNNIRADQVAAFGAQITNLMAAVGFTDCITALGTNDLSQGSGTASSILTNDQTI